MADRKWYIQPPSLLPPTLLGNRGFEPKNIPPLSDVLDDLVTKALYTKDMIGTAQLGAELVAGTTPGGLALINAGFFVSSIMPDALKTSLPAEVLCAFVSWRLKETADLFKASIPTSYQDIHAPDPKALNEALDKTFGALEQGEKLAKEANSWVELGLGVSEFYKKMSDAMKAVKELGDSMFDKDGSTEPQRKVEPPHLQEPSSPKSDNYPDGDLNKAGAGDAAGGLPSPDENSEFDG